MTLSVGNVGSEFTVVTNVGDWSDSTVLTNGNVVFAWAGSGGVFGRIYDSSGTALTSDFQLNESHSGIFLDTNGLGWRVVALPSGGFELVWEGTNQFGTVAPIYARTFDASGNALNSDVQVANGDTFEIDLHPVSIASLGGSDLAIAFTQDDNNGNESIKGEIIDSAGNVVASQLDVSNPTHYATDSSTAHLSGGGFIVVWYDGSTGAEIHAHLYDDNGNPVGSEILVSSTTTGSPKVSALASGGFVVGWNDYNGANFISARMYDASGTPTGSAFSVNTSAPADSDPQMSLAALASGGFVAAWTDDSHQGADTSGSAVRARVFDASGAAVGDDFEVNTTTANTQRTPVISALNDGGFVISWHDSNSQSIRAQLYSVTNDVAAPTVINGNSESLAAIDEDTTNPSGSSVQSLFASHFSDADANFAGVAVTQNGATTQGAWQFSSDNGTSWMGVGSPDSSNALLLAPTALVRFVPTADFNGAAPTLTAHLVNDSHGSITTGDIADLSTTGGNTSYSLDVVALGETINPENDPPVLANGGNTTSYVQQQATPPFIDAAITVSDIDSPNLIGATVKISSGFLAGDQLNFTDQHGVTGSYNAATGELTLTGTTSVANYETALRSITFSSTSDHPTDFGADPQRTIDWQVDDGAPGLSNTIQTTVNMTAINGPVNTVPGAQGATEDGGTAISGLSVSDPDAGSNTISTTLSVAHGTLTITSAGGATVSDSGTATVTLTGTVAEINTTLAAANNVLYAPTTDFNGPDTLTVTTNDQGNNASGTPVSDTETVTINVSAVNDAPTVVNGTTTTLAPISEDAASPAGDTITNLFGGHFSDSTDQIGGGSSANNFAGIAISANAATAAEGTWQWSTDGTNWNPISASLSDTGALVLSANTQLRFVPAADWNGTAPALTAHLLDDSSAITNDITVDLTATGTGGTTQYSTATVALSETVTALNDAPVASGSATLALINEDASNPAGDTVANLFAGNFSDATDQVTNGSSANTLAGVAVTANAATTEGNWQYFASGSWHTIGAVSVSSALLLDASTLVRFLPASNVNGAAPALTVHLVDNSAGAITTGNSANLGTTGGTTAYSSGTVALGETITALDDAPTATNLTQPLSLAEDAAPPKLFTNAPVVSDVDSSNVSVTLTLSDPSAGVLVGAGTGTNGVYTISGAKAAVNTALAAVTFAPAQDYNGSPTVGVAVSDGQTPDQGINPSGTVSITVTEVNDVPAANADTLSAIAEDSGQRSIAFAVLTANDKAGPITATDELATQHLTITAVSNAAGGTVSISGSNVLFTPAADYNGAASFDYTVQDDGTTNGSPDPKIATGHASFTITEVNDMPIPGNDTLSAVSEDSAQRTIGFATLTGNDSAGPSNEGSQTLTITGVSNAVGGTVSISGSNVLFTPAANLNGTASFDYMVQDNGTTNGSSAPASATGHASFTVTPVADTPSVTNASTAEDTQSSSGLVISRNVVDGAEVTNFKITGITNGTLFQNDGTTQIHNGDFITFAEGNAGLKFTPAADLNTPAGNSFSFDVQASTSASDAGLGSGIVTAHVTVTDVNDAPVPGNDPLSAVAEDSGQRTISFASLTANDSAGPANESGQQLTITGVSHAVGGTVSISGSNVLFTPGPNFNGTASFDYTVRDDGTSNGAPDARSADGHGSLTVTPVNDAPVASNGSASGNEDTVISGTLSASDVDGDSLTFSPATQAAHGSVTVNANGTFSYTPNANFNGTDSFTFKANDGSLNSNTATINLTVNPVNDAPAAQNGSASGSEDTVITGTLSASDIDSASLTFSLASQSSHGSVTVNANGTFSYTPNANYNGTDGFTFRANDGSLNSNAATVTLTINPVNDAPVAQNGAASGNEDSTINGILAADDVDGDSLTFTPVSRPSHGSVTVNANGTFSYTPDANYSGSDSFTFKANDGLVDSNVATARLTIDPVNDAPVIVSDGGADSASLSIAENTAAVTTVAATDVDSGLLTYSIVGGSDAAKFHIDGATGALSFINAPDFEIPIDADHNNTYLVQIRASDGSLSDDQVITVSVTDVNDTLPTVHWAASVDVGAHPAGWAPAGIGDFNHDATSDLAWLNPTTGDVDIWELANGQWSASSDVGSHPAGYQPVGFGDYNHDGTSDVLWFNPATRDVDLWEMSNGKWAGSVEVGPHPAGYTPSGTGDFNGDGTSDVLWFNPATRDVDIWQMSNGHWAASSAVGTHPGGYQPSLVGDFNGDGTSDIAWFNATTGDVDIWKMSKGQWAGSVDVGDHPTGYQPIGAADFNKDGVSDIVWYSPATNDIDIWLMQNGQWSASVDVGAHPAGSLPLGVGDFDQNGVADLMWQDRSTGHIENWMLAYS